jgi:hypothetical protein
MVLDYGALLSSRQTTNRKKKRPKETTMARDM